MPQSIHKVALIGFMGSGKSSIAPLLASRLDFRLVDIDAEIISRSGLATVSEIFSVHGEKFFRDLETEVASSFAQMSDIVISTGGGIIGRPVNIEQLKRGGGTIVFLRTTFETVTSRISDFSTRPLFRDIERARALFIERQPLYLKYADYVVDTDEKNPQTVCDDIIRKMVGVV